MNAYINAWESETIVKPSHYRGLGREARCTDGFHLHTCINNHQIKRLNGKHYHKYIFTIM